AKLTIYNVIAMITYSQKNIPNGKRINFAKAVAVCIRFITGKLSEESLLKILSKSLSPMRLGRTFPRSSSIKNPISFAYRIS
ncbi:MAG: IS4/IS5 family transposase, partial [Clostridiales bacterium]|nr:IS4/IS5 family transposase [Clostridiales bacterium]